MQSANKNIDDILNSLNGIKQAEARPFMHTRVMERIQDERSFWGQTVSIFSRPVIAFSCLGVILFANVYAIVSATDQTQQETAISVSSSTVTDVLQNNNYILATNDPYNY